MAFKIGQNIFKLTGIYACKSKKYMIYCILYKYFLQKEQNMDFVELPVIPLRGAVVFPNTHITFDVGREISRAAVEEAMNGSKYVFITAQKDTSKDDVTAADLYTIGTVSVIEQVISLPGGVARIVAKGETAARIDNVLSMSPYILASLSEYPTIYSDTVGAEAMLRALRDEYKKYFATEKRINAEVYMRNMTIPDPEVLCYVLSAEMQFDLEQKQGILEEAVLSDRVIRLLSAIANETNIIHIEQEIGRRVKDNIDKNQREYYLREQMKVIADELGEGEDAAAEAKEYRKKINALKASKAVRDKLLRDVDRFVRMNHSSSDSAVMRTYLDTVLDLPWNKSTKESLDISKASAILDEDHYGLKNVKERIVEYLAVRALKKGQGQVMCLVGPPGVGKTSVAKSIARALNRKFVRISLGGIHDEADIRGHRKTYIGAMPGRIIEAVQRAGSNNALILLDEIDKMGADYKGDPSAALLEVLDKEQNAAFRDHYIEVPFDLSNVMFILTANTCETLSAPLMDRLEVIELSGYTTEDKMAIAKKYLLPHEKENTGVDKVTVDADALRDIIEYYTREAGVRQLERELTSICRKAAKAYLTENRKSVRVRVSNVEKYLGKRKYSFDMMNEADEVGVVRGLAWTAVGGDTLSVEVNVMPGTGKIELTGKLGDVMKESAKAALSFIRSRSDTLGIMSDFYKEYDIHIHVPEGAVPKDGPSAGITIATAVASALTGRKVKRDIAMTGEITLRGNVLKIGGLKEKSLAAYRAGIKTIIIPKDNEADLDDIAKEIREQITFLPVRHADEVLGYALK